MIVRTILNHSLSTRTGLVRSSNSTHTAHIQNSLRDSYSITYSILIGILILTFKGAGFKSAALLAVLKSDRLLA